MFKFLRKYNKIILAVGGVLLMITFLIPQAITQFSQQAGARGATIATVAGGQEVPAADIEQAASELRLLERMQGRISILGPIRDPDHWYLLTREAEQAGFVAAPGVVSDEVVSQVYANTGERNPAFIRQTMTKLMGVEQLISLFANGGAYSDRRLVREAQRLLHSVQADLVVIEASKEEAAAVEPTQAQLQAQFEKYADRMPGEGEHGFGYKLPNRVKIEWLTIPATDVRNAVERSEAFDGVAQRVHWKRNEAGTFPPEEPSAAVPEVVRNHLLDKLTRQKLDEIAREAATRLRANRRGLPEKDGYVVLPDDWSQRQLALTELAEGLRSKYGLELPRYESAGDRWLSVAELAELEGVGEATTTKFGDRAMTLGELAGLAREFGGSHTIFVQSGVAGEPLRGEDGSIYVFRITAADASRAPNSLDEVRDAVVADLKRLAHYNQLVETASALEQEAETEGLLAVALKHDTRVHGQTNVHLAQVIPFQNQYFPINQPSSLPVIGQHRPTIEKIVEYALSLPLDKAISSLSAGERVIAIPVDDHLALVLAKLNNQAPLSREAYNALIESGSLHAMVMSEDDDPTQAVKDSFSFDALSARHQFKRLRTAEPQEEQEPTQEVAQGGQS